MAVISVGQLNRYVKGVLEKDSHLSAVYISGEISNFKLHYQSGHMYMSLKDETAAVRAVMFRGAAAHLAFKPEDGMKVIVKARVSMYEREGSFQIYIEEMQPDGVGALQIAFEQLKKRLAQEGLFDEQRKRPLPCGGNHLAHRRGCAGYPECPRAAFSAGAGGFLPGAGAGRGRGGLHCGGYPPLQ